MNVQVTVNAGVCGFITKATANCEDGQLVDFVVDSPCEKIQALAKAIKEAGPIDAFQEISPAGESIILSRTREVLKGCCAGCVVPVALFKSMQVAAGLALPSDISISMTNVG
ncbi:MAG TPA: hypothetical protein DET40_15100 [Lentisphaeria bacterium]|nr:MAG: hypothetical protein A2X45_03795 [Lentisphaerae bacterium GWF2_50_93]HCE44866.1 hypothetical protein [Lentisphaeria bacterium]